MLRAREQQQYQFQQTVQRGLLNYLELIEANVLQHQQETTNALATRLLLPLLEHSVRGGIDSFMTRALVERVFLKVRGKDESEFTEQNQMHDVFRDRKLLQTLTDITSGPQLEGAVLSRKPQIVAVPTRTPVQKKKEE